MTTTVSLQFDGDGNLATDIDGNPVYDRSPTGDLFLAMGVPLGSFHADRDLGSLVPNLTRGAARSSAEIKDAIQDGLVRLVEVGVIVVDAVLVFATEARVFTSATDQPFKVQL